jgi:hypothetical protein
MTIIKMVNSVGVTLWVNAEQILYFKPASDPKFTRIELTGERTIDVRQTPDEILRQIPESC